MPVLTVDGNFKLAQSNAISDYLGRKFGFAGNDELDHANVLSLALFVEDFRNETMFLAHIIAGRKQGNAEEVLENQIKPAVKKYTPLFEKVFKVRRIK